MQKINIIVSNEDVILYRRIFYFIEIEDYWKRYETANIGKINVFLITILYTYGSFFFIYCPVSILTMCILTTGCWIRMSGFSWSHRWTIRQNRRAEKKDVWQKLIKQYILSFIKLQQNRHIIILWLVCILLFSRNINPWFSHIQLTKNKN